MGNNSILALGTSHWANLSNGTELESLAFGSSAVLAASMWRHESLGTARWEKGYESAHAHWRKLAIAGEIATRDLSKTRPSLALDKCLFTFSIRTSRKNPFESLLLLRSQKRRSSSGSESQRHHLRFQLISKINCTLFGRHNTFSPQFNLAETIYRLCGWATQPDFTLMKYLKTKNVSGCNCLRQEGSYYFKIWKASKQ